MDDLLTRHDLGPVTRLTLSRPATYNALSLEMIEALIAALARIDDETRVVILAAEGKAFCAGHDLRQMQGMAPDQLAHLFDRCAHLMQMIPALPQPVIAQVQGVATAAGCQLVASCDMAVAADGARFGVNGVSIGLFCATPMVALTRAIPPKAAFEMLTTGDFITAPRAAELGLVNRVVPAADLEAETMRLADSIAAKPPQVIRMGKRAFHDQLGRGTAAAYAATAQVMCTNMAPPETVEGIGAFLEKRPPNWT